MITTDQIKLANQAALGIDADSDFDWKAWYIEKRDAFTSAAKSWRNIAHTAQLDGDTDVVRIAHGNALQNEAWAKDAEAKAKKFAL